MSDLANETQSPAKGAGSVSYILRVLWIAVRLCAVIILIDRGGTFFYQGF